MPAKILNGKVVRDEFGQKLMAKFKSLSYKPMLTIIDVGGREDTKSYIRAKKNFAEQLGVYVKVLEFSENLDSNELIEKIKEENCDEQTKGIIVQLPLPSHLDREFVINTIDPKKDVDALTFIMKKKWEQNEDGAILPATARGVKILLEYYGISLWGKKVAVIGRSDLVGRPIAIMCQNQGAEVEVCHRGTIDLKASVLNSDIIIVATGNPNLIKKDMVKSGQVIIDVGINAIFQELDGKSLRKIVGDVDFENVKDVVDMISPVPGGVGPLTVLSLFENLYDLCVTR